MASGRGTYDPKMELIMGNIPSLLCLFSFQNTSFVRAVAHACFDLVVPPLSGSLEALYENL